jgi:hypothetical protein
MSGDDLAQGVMETTAEQFTMLGSVVALPGEIRQRSKTMADNGNTVIPSPTRVGDLELLKLLKPSRS